jgi:hypothetical protein
MKLASPPRVVSSEKSQKLPPLISFLRGQRKIRERDLNACLNGCVSPNPLKAALRQEKSAYQETGCRVQLHSSSSSSSSRQRHRHENQILVIWETKDERISFLTPTWFSLYTLPEFLVFGNGFASAAYLMLGASVSQRSAKTTSYESEQTDIRTSGEEEEGIKWCFS